VADRVQILYLIGQFPAINHGYLLTEIQHLRTLGIEVAVASISDPDRPPEKMSAGEREETARTYYVKSVPALKVVLLNLLEFVGHPFRYLRGLFFALGLSRGSFRRSVYHLAYFAEAILVGRYMRQHDISHVHANFSATVSLIATHAFPVTMSFVIHGFGEVQNPTESQLTERVNGSCFVRAVSRHGRSQAMLACDRSQWPKLIHAPLGIEARKFVPAERAGQESTSVPLLICVGRLAPEKGQALLLDAMADLHREGLQARLLLVGDGPDREWLEHRAAELGIATSVEFAGWVDQTKIASLYVESDVCVLSSLAEGIPVVLMEAMAMEVPCVAPRITGIPELIEHGVDGLLFAPADVEDLAQQLRMLLDSPELRMRMGKAAREHVLRDYDIARNTSRFAVVLREQLQGACSKR
jgi:colanic acid/amylovoran biosynthesis glycosyltransferase